MAGISIGAIASAAQAAHQNGRNAERQIILDRMKKEIMALMQKREELRLGPNGNAPETLASIAHLGSKIQALVGMAAIIQGLPT